LPKKNLNSIALRCLNTADEAEFLANSIESKKLHKSWVIVPKTKKQFRDYVEEMNTNVNKAFAIIDVNTSSIVGVVELRDIFMFDFKNCYITYYAFHRQLRKGFMKSGVQQVIAFAFKKLKLHRLEANIQPENKASIALAKACGFKKEGFSPKFIKKSGCWRDHERWALLKI
jgi:ribosomal-protein-alanine N-acetyltransferase